MGDSPPAASPPHDAALFPRLHRNRHLPIEVTGIISRLQRRLHAVNTGAGRGVDGRILLPLLLIFIAPAFAAAPDRTEWADTQGGHGGAIVRVTNLNPDGPGSFKAAVERIGARVLVFGVGGVIGLGRSTLSRSTVIGVGDPLQRVSAQPGGGATEGSLNQH